MFEHLTRFIVSTIAFLMVAIGMVLGIFGPTVERVPALLIAILGAVVLFGSETYHLLLRLARSVERQRQPPESRL